MPTFASFGVAVPPGLEAIVRRCLELDEEDRHPNVAALARALAVFGGPGARLSAQRISGTLGEDASGFDLDEARIEVEDTEAGKPVGTTSEEDALADTIAKTGEAPELAGTVVMPQAVAPVLPNDTVPLGRRAPSPLAGRPQVRTTEAQSPGVPQTFMQGPATERMPTRGAGLKWAVGLTVLLGAAAGGLWFALRTTEVSSERSNKHVPRDAPPAPASARPDESKPSEIPARSAASPGPAATGPAAEAAPVVRPSPPPPRVVAPPPVVAPRPAVPAPPPIAPPIAPPSPVAPPSKTKEEKIRDAFDTR